MELTTAQPARGAVPHRVARAATRRRVGAYSASVTVAGFAWLVLAMPAAAQAAGRDPGPVLLLAGGTPALGRVRQGVGLRAWV